MYQLTHASFLKSPSKTTLSTSLHHYFPHKNKIQNYKQSCQNQERLRNSGSPTCSSKMLPRRSVNCTPRGRAELQKEQQRFRLWKVKRPVALQSERLSVSGDSTPEMDLAVRTAAKSTRIRGYSRLWYKALKHLVLQGQTFIL